MKVVKRILTVLAMAVSIVSIDTDISPVIEDIYTQINNSYVNVNEEFATAKIEISIMAGETVLYEKVTNIVNSSNRTDYSIEEKKLASDIYASDLYEYNESTGSFTYDENNKKELTPGYIRISASKVNNLKEVSSDLDGKLYTFEIKGKNIQEIFSLEDAQLLDIKNNKIDVHTRVKDKLAMEYGYQYYTLDESLVIIKISFTI